MWSGQIKVSNEEIEQVSVFKCLVGCLVGEDMRCNEEVKCRFTLAEEALNRQ